MLTGVIGGGEGGQTAHPQAEALARLLIDAAPIHSIRRRSTTHRLVEDSTFWLELLWAESNKRGEAGKWTTRAPRHVGDISAVDYLLGNAVPQHPRRAEWLLQHGANANACMPIRSNRSSNMRCSPAAPMSLTCWFAMAPSGPCCPSAEAFLAAAMQGDAATLRRLVDGHPEYLRSPHAMFAAIQQQRTDIAELLLDLGTSPNVADHKGFSALHFTTHCGAVEIAQLLIARGADVDAHRASLQLNAAWPCQLSGTAGDGRRHRPVQPRHPRIVFRRSDGSPRRVVGGGSFACLRNHSRRRSRRYSRFPMTMSARSKSPNFCSRTAPIRR